MNRFNLIILSAALCLAASFTFTSCSKDDPEPPSRIIEKVQIYKGKEATYQCISVVDFTYDSRQRLIGIRSDSPLSVVNYIYKDDGNISFTHTFTLPDGNSKLNEVNGKLEEGKINICTSSLLGNCVYFYKNNLLSEAAVGRDIKFSYAWGSTSMKLTSSPSVYSSSYTYSQISNDYSFDLNILAQLIDPQEDYCVVMNTYAQAIGILGNKFKTVLENEDYTYEYAYDPQGRLISLSLVPKGYNMAGENDNYTFKLKYRD